MGEGIRKGVAVKSYNNLYEKLFTEENIRDAIISGAKNKRKNNKRHRKLRYIKRNADEYIPVVRDWILNFEPPSHREIEINDGVSAKKRIIIVPTYQEVIVHHAVINILKPLISKGMYEHSYASIPGRGIHKAMKRVKWWIYNDVKNTKYCLKLDIRKFFDSVDQDVLLAKLRKINRDRRYFDYLEKIIRTTKKGIPLGFNTSQWFANFLLTELDHKIKEEWAAKYYIRFMDDMVIFGSNKRKLHQLRVKIEKYLNEELHLQLKDNWQVFLMDNPRSRKKGRFLDFLGFKFYRDHVGLRRAIALKAQRKAKRIYKKSRANIKDARQMVTYAGYAKYSDCHYWFKIHVSKYVSIRHLRKHISRYDKRKQIRSQISHKL